MTMPYLCPVPTDLPIAPEGVGAPLPAPAPTTLPSSSAAIASS